MGSCPMYGRTACVSTVVPKGLSRIESIEYIGKENLTSGGVNTCGLFVGKVQNVSAGSGHEPVTDAYRAIWLPCASCLIEKWS